jgi:ComF family protein
MIFSTIADWLFPKECIACQHEGSFLCKKCASEINPSSRNTYKTPYLDRVHVLFSWEDKLVQKIIKKIKFYYAKGLIEDMDSLLKKALEKVEISNAILVPVPLHSRRLKSRGFNQSELLAQKIGQILDLQVQDVLIRIRNTAPQAKLKAADRTQNMQNAFCVKEKFIKVNQKFVIIDDVTSTNSTINECAKCLRKAGFEKIEAICLAKGDIHNRQKKPA